MAKLSDLLPLSLQASATILGAGSQLARGEAMSAIGARRAAEQQYEAKQLVAEGEQSRGVGLRAAQDETLRGETVNSAALARAAASGAGASDPTVMNIMERTSGMAAYRAALAMYEGEAQARLDVTRAGALNFEAGTNVADAAAAKREAGMGAVSTLLSGGTKALSMYQRFYSGQQQEQPAPAD